MSLPIAPALERVDASITVLAKLSLLYADDDRLDQLL